jgi:hypothetical protein
LFLHPLENRYIEVPLYISVSEFFFQQLYEGLSPIEILHKNANRLEAFNAITVCVYVDSRVLYLSNVIDF